MCEMELFTPEGRLHPGLALLFRFIPPQVSLRRANVATDNISDRNFEVVQPQKRVKRRPGRPRCMKVSNGVRKRLLSWRGHPRQLGFVPPQVLRPGANVATDCISDRRFEAMDLLSFFDGAGGTPSLAPSPKRLRLAGDVPTSSSSTSAPAAVPHIDLLRPCAQVGQSKGRGSAADLLRIATLGRLLSSQALHVDPPLQSYKSQGSLPPPRPCYPLRLALEPSPCACILPIGVVDGQAPCQIELSSNLEGPPSGTAAVPERDEAEPSELCRLAELAPGCMESLGSLDDLHGRRRCRRWPHSRRVCIACRPLLDPPRGRWLRYAVCSHRCPKARRPVPPPQMRLLCKKRKKKMGEHRERGRWSHLDGKRRRRCVHGLRQGLCSECGRGNAFLSFKDCRPCPHGKLKGTCDICKRCCHGQARGSCLICSGCPHGLLRSACVLCSPCPHGRLRGNCKLCRGCPHGRLRAWCPQCSGCEHGRIKFSCRLCNGCEHGRLRRLCPICKPCPHGLRKEHCTVCSGCSHGLLRQNCRFCSGCPHQRVRRFCSICNPCPHGKRKQSCVICSPCPHGRIANSCPDCNGCPHGRVRRFCKICNGCPHGTLWRFCKLCTPEKIV